MVGWYHQLNRHEFEQTLGDSEGQRSLVCCSPWSPKESDTAERLNITKELNLGLGHYHLSPGLFHHLLTDLLASTLAHTICSF